MPFEVEDIIKILAAFLAGACLGAEREYGNKAAGFRTLILITIGATVFTILSHHFFATGDRIASNIVTGIGFIGAGVIFKTGPSIHGITTAATIWMAAAIGMSIGVGDYWLAAIALIFVMATLIIMNRMESAINNFMQAKTYMFTVQQAVDLQKIEADLRHLNLTFTRKKLYKENNLIKASFKVIAGKVRHNSLANHFAAADYIVGFDV